MPGEDELIEGQQKFQEGLRTILEVLPIITTFTVRVESGDTLWTLASRFFNDGQRWRELYLMNIDIITRYQSYHNSMPGPDMIYPGQDLRVWAI